MDTTHQDSTEWEACPSGELQGLATRLKVAERRRQQMSAARMGGFTAASTAALVVALGLVFGGGHAPLVGGITCAECKANFDGYFQHLSAGADLKANLAEQMANHLDACSPCREKFESEHPGELDRAGVLSAEARIDWRAVGGLGYAAAY